ncbi:MAG: SUMF1/EgtB/PvdO family nonheme iron enzyme, partial [Muribaculaceae bacterium]|nr:SUMF1/EgtB/PvdO family nonheme iron enzyme [Muribaculaceae bacterium]
KITGKTFRLPTEAEWEYAARGGNKSKGYKYSGSNTIGDVAWYNSNSSAMTHQVGTKAPNELGLYDMSGNVWECCSDWHDENYYSSSPSNNPTGPTSGSYRVDRGGSWGNNARSCRVSYRDRSTPDYRDCYYGFRLVCSSL